MDLNSDNEVKSNLLTMLQSNDKKSTDLGLELWKATNITVENFGQYSLSSEEYFLSSKIIAKLKK